MLTSAQIQKDIEDFLRRGKTIEKLKPGESALDGLFGAMLHRARQMRARKIIEETDNACEES